MNERAEGARIVKERSKKERSKKPPKLPKRARNLILGSGNAAMEMVDNLRNFAADLQVAARRVADSQARDTKCAPTPSASVVYILNSDRHYKEV